MVDENKKIEEGEEIEMQPYKEKGPKPRTGHSKTWTKRRAKEKARRKANAKHRR